MLALPTKARGLGQRLFHHRGGVDENLDLGAGGGLDQPAAKALEALLDQIMIILALRIDADGAARALPQDRPRIRLGRIAFRQHDHRPRRRPERGGVAAPFHPLGHPAHLAMQPGGHKGLEPPGGLGDRIGGVVIRALANPFGQGALDQAGLQIGHRAPLVGRPGASPRTPGIFRGKMKGLVFILPQISCGGPGGCKTPGGRVQKSSSAYCGEGGRPGS